MADKFRVGQQVQCKNDVGFLTPYLEQTPVRGRRYTIREIIAKPTGPCLRLREIVNPPAHYAGGETECSFSATRFEAGDPAMPFFTVRGPLPISGGGGGTPTFLKTDNPAEGTNGSSVAFVGAALGAGDATRITVVAVNTQSVVATGVDIGGITATLAVAELTALSGLQLWYANTSALGTTATITLTAGGTMTSPHIFVAQLTNVTALPSATNSANNAGADPSTITATVPSTGFGVTAICTQGTTTGTWTNATVDYLVDTSGTQSFSMAHTGTAGSQTPTYTGLGGASSHIVMACWGP